MNIAAVLPLLCCARAEAAWFVSLDGTPNPKPSSVIEFDADAESAKDLIAYLSPRLGTRVLQFITSKPPGPTSEFVEVEDLTGKSVSLSGWHKRADGYFVLFIRQAL